MTDALEDHEGTVIIGGRTVTNLWLAADINGLAGEEEEQAKVVECLDKASTAYSMEAIMEIAKSQRAVENKGKWRKLVVKSSVVPQRPSRLKDR